MVDDMPIGSVSASDFSEGVNTQGNTAKTEVNRNSEDFNFLEEIKKGKHYVNNLGVSIFNGNANAGSI